MKNNLLVLITILYSNIFLAQLPTPVQVVQAPTLEAQAAKEFTETIKQSQEAVKQTTELKKSFDLLEEAKNALEKVTDRLFEVNTTRNVISSQARIITRSNTLFQEVKKIRGLTPQGVANLTNFITQSVLASEDLIRLTTDLLTTGIFKMNDSERLKTLNDIEKKLDVEHQKLTYISKRINYLKTLNEYQDLIEN